MSEGNRCQFTDTMIHVAELDSAARFWTGVMGMVEIERSDTGIILEDPDSKQRITLVSSEFETDYALAVATSNMKATLDLLRARGANVPEPVKADSGLEYALCKDPFGIPIMVYVTESATED
ncbi:MAG: VOC family protein [Candidatus Zixiibacteriota bacterium]